MSTPENFTDWRKSTYSPDAGNCVEAGRGERGKVGVRDTKDFGDGPILEFSATEWGPFIAGLKASRCMQE